MTRAGKHSVLASPLAFLRGQGVAGYRASSWRIISATQPRRRRGEDHIRRRPDGGVTVGRGEGQGGHLEHGDVVEPIAHAVDVLPLHLEVVGHPQHRQALVGPPWR